MCFGVRDAIALALQQAAAQPLTVLGELVHNEAVLASLQEKGIRIRHDPATVTTPTVMITAHGASERMMNQVRARGLNVTEATCPLVRFAHRAVSRFVEEGYHPVIVGKRDHVEVRGLTEDLREFDIVLSDADVDGLQERPRFGIAAQTTQPVERVRHLVFLIRRRFPGCGASPGGRWCRRSLQPSGDGWSRHRGRTRRRADGTRRSGAVRR